MPLDLRYQNLAKAKINTQEGEIKVDELHYSTCAFLLTGALINTS